MSKNRCQTCEKFIPVDHSKIQEGDKVQFGTVVRRGRSTHFSTKEGKVLTANDTHLGIDCRKKIYRVPRTEATPIDAPTPLSFAMIGTCTCESPVPGQ